MAGADRDRSAGGDGPAGGTPASGAAPADVAALLRTFSAAPPSRGGRRARRADAPTTIVPLLSIPDPGDTPLDPDRIDAARWRLKIAALEGGGTESGPSPAGEAVRSEAFDEAKARLRRGRSRPPGR